MLNFQANPDRLWSSNTLDLHRDAHYSIDNTVVLSSEELGPTVKNSNLRSVGVLNGLAVNGDMNLDQFVFWNSGMNRLGVGIEAGNGQLSVASNYVEFRVQPNEVDAEVGTYTTHDLRIQTDSTDRILVKANGDVTIGTQGGTDKKVKIHGKLAVGINNIRDDADFEVAGPVRMEGKRFSVADDIPTVGVHAKGDIVWNSNPVPGSVVGWICVNTGTPGEWKSFGNISQ